MKFGVRKPSIKRSIKARTTGRLKRSVKKSINPLYGKKGMGLINNPKKAVYNKVYNKTTIGVSTIFKSGGIKKLEKKTLLDKEKELVSNSVTNKKENDSVETSSEEKVFSNFEIIFSLLIAIAASVSSYKQNYGIMNIIFTFIITFILGLFLTNYFSKEK